MLHSGKQAFVEESNDFPENDYYSGTLILRYGKGQQNCIIKSGYHCKKLPTL